MIERITDQLIAIAARPRAGAGVYKGDSEAEVLPRPNRLWRTQRSQSSVVWRYRGHRSGGWRARH